MAVDLELGMQSKSGYKADFPCLNGEPPKVIELICEAALGDINGLQRVTNSAAIYMHSAFCCLRHCLILRLTLTMY